MARRVPDHAAPAAADVEQPVTGLQGELVEHQPVLVLLGLLEGRRGVGVARAGVGHRRAEHHLVEAVRHVVVVADRPGVAGHRVPQALGGASPARQALLGWGRRRGEALHPERARDLERRGRGGPLEAHVGEVDEQVVGVAGVDALDREVTGDVGAGQAEVAGCSGEVRRGAWRAQVQGAGGVGRPQLGPVVGDEAEPQRAGDDRLDDLGDGHLFLFSGRVESVVVAAVRRRGPPWHRGRAAARRGPTPA